VILDTVTQHINQKSYADTWVGLGTYAFGDPGPTVTSSDATGVRKQELAWDAIRFTRIDPPAPPPPSTTTAPASQPTPPEAADTPAEPIVAQSPTDSDHDGVNDASDLCPKVPAGKFDSNGDGCPGPIRAAAAQPHDVLTFIGRQFRPHEPDKIYLLDHTHLQLPLGAQATYRCAPCSWFSGRFRGGRPVTRRRSGRLIYKTLHQGYMYAGSRLQLVITQPAHMTRVYTYTLKTGDRRTREEACERTVNQRLRLGPCPP
jgi:hypothetical protein